MSAARGFDTRALWIGPELAPVAARAWWPRADPPGSGVLLLPPLGYHYWTTHGTVRALAERLAGEGHLVLRVDYLGTGDSAGEQTAPGRWPACAETLRHGVAQLRAWGVEQVVLAGIRIGGTLALLHGARSQASAVVAVAPVVSGRRYVRELALLSGELQPPPEVASGTIFQAGTVFPADMVQALSSLDLAGLAEPPAPRVLIVSSARQPAAGSLLDRLSELGPEVSARSTDAFEAVFDHPAEEADVVPELVTEISRWIGPGLPGSGRLDRTGSRASLTWNGRRLEEEMVEVGPHRLAGVLAHPDEDPRAIVVMLNSGSEVHVGPGRAWVEYSRALAGHGFGALRVDFRGWGDSPSDGHAPGRPYDRHTWDDTREIVDDLRSRGHRRIVLLGLCAGAWVALKVATEVGVDGVVAINPQLYWQPGDPVEALMSTTRRRRLSEIEHFRQHGAELERAGGHPAADWLRSLQCQPAPVLTLFARGDDGLEFLQDRLPSTWREVLDSGAVRLDEVEIDHPMHHHWRRASVIERMLAFLESAVAGEPGRVSAPAAGPAGTP